MAGEFYAVFVKSRYHVPGDERSRTNPGHGYPAHDVEYTEVIEFQSLELLRDWVLKNDHHASYSKKQYRAVKCTPLSVVTAIEVTVT